MYHARFKGTHYEIGLKWGGLLLKNGRSLLEGVPFPITEERILFSRQCIPFYQEYYPEVLEEIEGIAKGQKIPSDQLLAVLLGMYCIMPENKCSCVAFKSEGHIILARNSDFLTAIEKLYMNCIYKFETSGVETSGKGGLTYSFQGNTTAFVEMEDGVNEHGLAIGLTSVYPAVLGVGLNAGMLLRYGLERCRTVKEFTEALKVLPIASSQTFTAADRSGDIAVIECNCERISVERPDGRRGYVSAVNSFHSEKMQRYVCRDIDDWNAEERYQTIETAFRSDEMRDMEFAERLLSGCYGFICQYDRSTGKDTVWSAVYDLETLEIRRCEGNPSRKKFRQDTRFLISGQ